MEQPSRKISCSMSQSLQRFTSSEDRFSSLPDGVAHYLITFLTMKDISRLNVVSKRCRELCRSLPSLTFDCTKYSEFDSLKRAQLMNFLDNYLLQRNGMAISTFRVRWYYQNRICYEEYRVLTWLQQSLRCNADMIDLELFLDSGVTFVMPLGIFSCNTLRILKVDLHGGILKLPSSDGFTHIQSLSLKRVKIIAECFGEWFSSSCKFLAELYLDHVYGVKNISITSSSLKYVVFRSYLHTDLCHLNISGHMLQELSINWRFDSSPPRSLNIYAPNLECLRWDGRPPDFYSLGNLKYLSYLLVFLEPYGSRGNHNFVELLRHIEGIKYLTIYAELVKALFDQGFLPISFDNLHTMHIYFRHSDSLNANLIPALASLLSGSPNLKTILLRTWPPSTSNMNMIERVTNLSPMKVFGSHTGFWESQDLIFINKLEEVEIELIKGVIEVEQIKYLLKHAKELKKMVIFYSPPVPSNFVEMVNEFKTVSTARIDLCRQ